MFIDVVPISTCEKGNLGSILPTPKYGPFWSKMEYGEYLIVATILVQITLWVLRMFGIFVD